MLPEDDLSRDVTIARPDADSTLPHVAVIGNVYTVLVSAKQSAGRYAVIDMFVPPGGGRRRTATISSAHKKGHV